VRDPDEPIEGEDMQAIWRSVAYGVHELVRANAANIHAREHWKVVTDVVAAAGARRPLAGRALGAPPVEERAVSCDTLAVSAEHSANASPQHTTPLLGAQTRSMGSQPHLPGGERAASVSPPDDEWIHVGGVVETRRTSDEELPPPLNTNVPFVFDKTALHLFACVLHVADDA